MPDTDPFAHHPELRDLITDPETSFFRTFSVATLLPQLLSQGLPVDWWYSDAEREALRRAALTGREDAPLWVFAYGSLMWDPAFRFTDLRRARAPQHARRFILKDTKGARGTPEAPGLMAALDDGPGCEGLAYLIPAEAVEHETEILWRREQLGPAYHARFIELDLSDSRITALTFVANHASELIVPDLPHAEQVRILATGTGFMGSSFDYLANIASHFRALGIDDPDVVRLLRDTDAYRAEGVPTDA